MNTLNNTLMRVLIASIFLSAGFFSTSATDMFGLTGLTVSGAVTVSSNLTFNSTEGAVPRGAFILWDGASCPSGWTEVTTYSNRFPRGSTSVTTGGSDTHTHTSSESHSDTLSLASTGTHTHTYTFGGGSHSSHTHSMTNCGLKGDGGIDGTYYNPSVAVAAATTPSAHSIPQSTTDGTVGAHTHSLSGGIAASTDSSSSETSVPLYYTLKVCQKW